MVARCKKCLRPVLGHKGRTGMNFCTDAPLKNEEVNDAEAVYVEDDDSAVKEDQMSREQLLSVLAGQTQTIDALKKEVSKSEIPPGSLGGAAGGLDIASMAEELMKKNKDVSDTKTAHEEFYKGPNLPEMRKDPVTANMADQIMEQILARNPWLNPRGHQPLGGAAQSSGPGLGREINPISNVSFTLPAVMGNTKVCNEPQPHLFLPNNTIVSEKKVTEKNINLPCYVLGYLKYLIAVCDGRQTKLSSSEFMARLHGLANVVEIVVTNSSTAEHQSNSWQIAREYSNRVFTDVEQGKKTWESMSSSLQTESYILAKDHLEVSFRSSRFPVKPNDKADKRAEKKSMSIACANYNSVQNEGNVCAWEISNAGMRCNRLHVCAHCFTERTASLCARWTDSDDRCSKEGSVQVRHPDWFTRRSCGRPGHCQHGRGAHEEEQGCP